MAGTPVREWDPRSTSVRAALLAGFAVVFGLWLLWGYELVRNLQRIEQNVSSVHESEVRGEQTLSKIMEKLDVHSAAEIVLYAVRRGVIR